MDPIENKEAAKAQKTTKSASAIHTKAVELKPRDIEHMAVAWQCIEGNYPKIDYGKFAKALNLKTERSASIAFGRLKAKLKRISEDQGSGSDNLVLGKPKARKRSADDTESSLEDMTPPKRAKTSSPSTGGQASTKSVDKDEAEVEDDEAVEVDDGGDEADEDETEVA